MSDNPYYIYGQKGKGSQQRVPVEEPEGIWTEAFHRDPGGAPLPGGVSLTKIEVGDLLSEGEINGLVTAEYTYVGTIGTVGWDSATEITYDTPAGVSVNYLRSIYWNEVPVVNSKNEYNFNDINVGFTAGLPAGYVLPSASATNSRLNNETTISRAVNERLRYGTDFAKTYRILNKNCIKVHVNIKLGQFSTSSKDTSTMGDLLGTRVDVEIWKRPIYASVGNDTKFKLATSMAIQGKISFGFIATKTITLNDTTGLSLLQNLSNTIQHKNIENDLLGYEIKIIRVTKDSIDSATRNQTFIDSITEVYGDTYAYPCSAIVFSKFSAEFFSSIPARAYDVKLLKVKIPSNYSPIAKQYSPTTWDGTFAATKQWTDNPAWCYYDLITNTRYGLGKYIDPNSVDKWTLYNIGRYCDTIVDNGEGGKEPRFTCNLLINSREDAYKVVNDFASIFRAITYYGAGTIFAVQDSIKTPLWQFTNANVENGDFAYSSTSRRVRNTVATVRYNDKSNFYKPAIEYIEDIDGIKKYGIREVELTAFGCVSRGQALRYGRWALLSETLETESVSFNVGAEGARIAPGDIIQTFDANRHESRYGGRLESAYQFGAKTRLTLDSYITGFVDANWYKISVLTPTYTYDPSLVSDLDSSDTDNIRRNSLQTRTFLGSFASGITGTDSGVRTDISFLNGTYNEGFNVTDYDISGRYVWMIENSGNANDISYNVWDYWRALRIEEQEDGTKYSISAIEYNEDKFSKIESGLAFEQPSYGNAPTVPNNLILDPRKVTDHTQKIHYTIDTNNILNVAGFIVYAKFGSYADTTVTIDLIDRLPVTVREGDYFPSQNGTYYFTVFSINSQGVRSTSSLQKTVDITNNYPLYDITISSLVLSTGSVFIPNAAGNQTDVTTDEINPIFKWQVGVTTEAVSVPTDIQYRITFREPNPNSNTIPNNNIYYQVTGYQTSDFTYELPFTGNKGNFVNSLNGQKGPFRDFEVVVEAMTTDGNSSAGAGTIHRIPPELENIDYSNSLGYDILYVTNPPIRDNLLSEGSKCLATDTFCTDQWITSDGDVKINITKGDVPDDLAGAFVYTSKQNFDSKDVKDATIRTAKDIQIFDVNNTVGNSTTSNYLLVSPNYVNEDTAYVAVGFYDVFDQALKDDYDIPIQTDPNYGFWVSPSVKIQKKSNVKQPALFQAWVDLSLNHSQISQDGLPFINFDNKYNVKDVTWRTTLKVGIDKSITSESYVVNFVTPLPTTTYTVFITKVYNPMARGTLIEPTFVLGQTSSIETTATSKSNGGFIFTIQYPNTFNFSNLSYSNYFIGVISP